MELVVCLVHSIHVDDTPSTRSQVSNLRAFADHAVSPCSQVDAERASDLQPGHGTSIRYLIDILSSSRMVFIVFVQVESIDFDLGLWGGIRQSIHRVKRNVGEVVRGLQVKGSCGISHLIPEDADQHACE